MGYLQSLKVPSVKAKIASNNNTQEKTLFKVMAIRDIGENSV